MTAIERAAKKPVNPYSSRVSSSIRKKMTLNPKIVHIIDPTASLYASTGSCSGSSKKSPQLLIGPWLPFVTWEIKLIKCHTYSGVLERYMLQPYLVPEAGASIAKAGTGNSLEVIVPNYYNWFWKGPKASASIPKANTGNTLKNDTTEQERNINPPTLPQHRRRQFQLELKSSEELLENKSVKRMLQKGLLLEFKKDPERVLLAVAQKADGKKNWMVSDHDLMLLEFAWIELIEKNKSVRIEELAEVDELLQRKHAKETAEKELKEFAKLLKSARKMTSHSKSAKS
ncbi:putative exoribonuclease II [Forsythia ovata]|uniref:Exoribonuclease II n=1 Tax=Forsythia ovata TaxID=205694 RepID=A0ABD1UAQ7_9LAMI